MSTFATPNRNSSVVIASLSEGLDCMSIANQTVCNFTTTENSIAAATPPYDATVTGILSTLAAITSLCTVGGNIMVVLAFCLEKSIRQPSNYLIASLAVTDILIGLFSMPLYTLYLLKGTWPLGQTPCDLWLSLDYTVCLVSQYTVFLITLDRFCSVKVPTLYRNWRTKGKIKVMISATWLIPALIFFTCIMGWRHFVKGAKPVEDGSCYAQFQQSQLFTAILVISYYWVTLVIMIGLYAGIYKVALTLHSKSSAKRNRIKKMNNMKTQNGHLSQTADSKEQTELLQKKHEITNGHADLMITDSTGLTSSTGSNKKGCKGPTSLSPAKELARNIKDSEESDVSIEHSSDSRNSTHPSNNNDTSIITRDQLESPIWKPRNSLPNTSINWDAFTESAYSTLHKEDQLMAPPRSSERQYSAVSTEIDDHPDSISTSSQPSSEKPKGINHLTKVLANVAHMKPKNILKRRRDGSKKHKSKSENRARKALRTITFILGAFVLCWTPYHVLVLIDAFCKERGKCLNETFYSFTYWLCYGNSPLNPFAYALANQQFKKAFLKIMKGEYIRIWLNRRR